MAHRNAPERVLPWRFEELAAEVARQCIAEWDARTGTDERQAACERMAILIDLGRQQAALMLERATGKPTPRWSVKAKRSALATQLVRALWENPATLPEPTIHLIRAEVMRPYTQHREG